MKVIIIGAGIIGITSAYYLAKAGYDVEVIDRQDGPGKETSFANGGMITPSMADPWNSPGILSTLIKNIGRSDSAFLLRLKALPSLLGWGLSFLKNSTKKNFYKNLYNSAALSSYSLLLVKEIREEHNLEYDHSVTGSMKVFRDEEGLEKYSKIAKELGQHGMRHQILSPDEVGEIEPSLKPVLHELSGGIYYPDDEAGNAYLFTCELEKVTKGMGVKYQYGTSVQQIKKTKGIISSVLTDQGEIKGDKFVLCAGSFSTPLAKRLGLDIPVRPVKGYSLSVPMNGWNRGPKMPIIDDGLHAAIAPLGKTLRIAGTAEFAGYDDKLDQGRIDNLYNMLGEVYEDFIPLFDKKDVEEWCGFRPLSPDGSPYIGATDVTNLYVNTGHGPLGWTMAAGSGKMLSDIMKGAAPEIDAAPYSYYRN